MQCFKAYIRSLLKSFNSLHFLVAKWKKLIAKIVTTRERLRNGGDVNQVVGSPIPGIELYDIVEGK